jgi:2-oxoglutarate dehydrogenase E2 component (dihydrolipoamide succinyltransferase)
MIIELKIPSPGESISEVDLAKWLVIDGESVEKNQEIGEIESEKATLPLIASESGKIHILVQAGSTVAVGAIACTIDTEAKGSTSSVKKNAKPDPLIKTEPAKERVQQAAPPKQENIQPESDTSVKTTPLARQMMDEHHLSVEDILKGLKKISTKEVEFVLQSLAPSGSSKSDSREISRNRMPALRRKLSQRLVAVKNETAMLTTFNEADMSAIISLRQKYQKAFQEKYGVKLGFMSFFTKAASESLRLFPHVNSMIDGEDILTPEYIDIAIAVQAEKGLMVPVIRNVENLTISQVELKIQELASKARSNKITMEEMSGGTFSITNGGIFGSLMSTPILNPPQSAILGMHNIVERPVAINGKVEIRPMMYLALSYDHRIIDGKDSVSFLVHIKELVENPQRLLLGENDPDRLLLGI